MAVNRSKKTVHLVPACCKTTVQKQSYASLHFNRHTRDIPRHERKKKAEARSILGVVLEIYFKIYTTQYIFRLESKLSSIVKTNQNKQNNNTRLASFYLLLFDNGRGNVGVLKEINLYRIFTASHLVRIKLASSKQPQSKTLLKWKQEESLLFSP